MDKRNRIRSITSYAGAQHAAPVRLYSLSTIIRICLKLCMSFILAFKI